ncbi:Ammonium transporter [Corchorus olitorius]|uniref:Ammonium transporter n=1 Tax=Corchorus olitorius TaxID=93759 RepID=A0A1R3KD19_9ROSI|nr:Ammonium transporter [Corchorus olitorius]
MSNFTLPQNLQPDAASPDWLNKGDNAWQLTAATMVGLQSVPGLVILYGSIVKKKWAVNSAFMALYAFAAVLVCWVGWGYRMAFGDKFIHFLGMPNVSLDAQYLIDKAFLGAGLLWLGWTGFNGGDPYTVSTDASLAVLNTHVCTATSLLTWLMLDIIFFGKPSVIGATQGMITGLVCITPAAGVVQGWAAILMGIMSGSIPWYTMMVLHKKIWLLKQVDDTMAVFHTHAVAGSLGGILTGVFAVPKLSRLFYLVDNWQHYTGLFYGFQMGRTTAGFKQFGIQILGIVYVVTINILVTSIICLLISVIVPLRLAEDELQTGDDAIHGEEAYALWGDGEKYESKMNSVYEEFPPASKGGEVEMA